MTVSNIGAKPAAPAPQALPSKNALQTFTRRCRSRNRRRLKAFWEPLRRPRSELAILRRIKQSASRDVEAPDGLAEMAVAEIDEQRRKEEAE
jgi:hypothetical protein